MKHLAPLFLIILFLSPWAQGKLMFPKGLSRGDRIQILETLGASSGVRTLSDPYPLGGYSGVEIGVTSEVIPTAEVSRLGQTSVLQGETSYTQLSFAKGLYYNVDIFLNFAPLGQGEEVSSFGGGLRWGFYEAEYWPLTWILQAAGNSTGFQNQLQVSTQNLELLCSLAIQDVSVYLGYGSIKASGSFIGGGVSGITDSGQSEEESIVTSRYLGGLVLKFSPVFLALELERSNQTSYGAKLGFRF